MSLMCRPTVSTLRRIENHPIDSAEIIYSNRFSHHYYELSEYEYDEMATLTGRAAAAAAAA